MLKDFYYTLVKNGELTPKGYFFAAGTTHVFLLGAAWFIVS
jgi:hypothetical protein